MLEDSDIQLAVEKGYASRMANNAQACINAKRFIVAEGIYDQFKEALVEKCKTAKLGDPNDKERVNLGPLAVKRLTDNLRQQVTDSLNQGVSLVHGSLDLPANLADLGGDPAGNYFSPLVLDEIPASSRAYSEEFFGPVFSLFPVKNDAEAIELANDNAYGLGASVWTKDIERAERMAREIDSGMVWVNDNVASMHDIPWGGFKDSGHGRECRSEGTVGISTRKSVVIQTQEESK